MEIPPPAAAAAPFMTFLKMIEILAPIFFIYLKVLCFLFFLKQIIAMVLEKKKNNERNDEKMVVVLTLSSTARDVCTLQMK